MSLKENSRLLIMASVDRGETQVKEAARLLNISTRQVRRLLKALRTQGAQGLAHGNRGREPVNALSAELRSQILRLLCTDYADFNNQHVASMLARRDHIIVSRMTISRIRQQIGLPSPVRRRPARAHHRRERMLQAGVLVQIDGSQHAWFEQRSAPCCLLAAVDDATGMLLAAVFCQQESLFGYLDLMRQVVQHYGIPAAVYSDRHTIHVSPKHTLSVEQQLQGLNTQTHLGRCLSLLGISQVLAWSPEAKGRIERLNETLQDRLVKELRLAGISQIAGANQFLPGFICDHNSEFGVSAVQPEPAFRPMPPSFNWDYVFSIRETRIVQSDNTVCFQGLSLQIPQSPTARSYAKARVEVCSMPDGRLSIAYKGVFIAGPSTLEALVAAPRTSPKSVASGPPAPRRSSAHTPASDHPWKQTFKIYMANKATQGNDS